MLNDKTKGIEVGQVAYVAEYHAAHDAPWLKVEVTRVTSTQFYTSDGTRWVVSIPSWAWDGLDRASTGLSSDPEFNAVTHDDWTVSIKEYGASWFYRKRFTWKLPEGATSYTKEARLQEEQEKAQAEAARRAKLTPMQRWAEDVEESHGRILASDLQFAGLDREVAEVVANQLNTYREVDGAVRRFFTQLNSIIEKLDRLQQEVEEACSDAWRESE